jgi:hypothetical protein
MRGLQRWVLVLMLAVLPAASVYAAQKTFRADLTGKKEVPGVKTPATGDLKLILSGGELSFELNVDGITSPSAANIHKGRKGENGPPLAGLFGGPTRMGPFSGILAEGVITDQSLLGELQGKRVADLVRLIRSGQAYVNILTETYPAGEIRGQIK